MSEILYRKAEHEDFKKILALETTVWGTTRDDSDLILLIRYGYAYVACINKKIIGAIIAVRAEDANGPCIAVMSWLVHPDFRKQGVGKKLYSLIFEKNQRVIAYVRTTNDPSALAYVRLGFSIIDTVKRKDSIAWIFEWLPT